MSQTINLKVEHTNKLAQENEALRSQVEVLRLAALNAISFMPGGQAKAQLRDAYDATPAQYLAEIKAQGIMDALSYAKEKCSTYLDVDFYAMEYANLLTDAAKGG